MHSVYSYALLLIGTVIIIQRSIWRKQGSYRRQAVALLVAVLAPWVGNILYLSGKSPIPYLDLTPFAFTLTVAALAWGVFGFGMIDLTPIARSLVVAEMNDGMIVIDEQGKIADINPAAQAMMQLTGSAVIGKPALLVLSPWAPMVERYADKVEVQNEISVGEGNIKRWFDLRLAPLHDRELNQVGRVITLHDITKRRLAEERVDQLTRQQQIILENIPVGVALQKIIRSSGGMSEPE